VSGEVRDKRRLGSHVIAALTAILIRVPAPEYLPSRRWRESPAIAELTWPAGSLLKTKVSR